jgi:acetyl coenzyme A synthetase (ADP forming)-like protein
MSSTATVYPWEREADVVLRDGATIHVRPVRAEDAAAVHSFLETVSPESIGYRFFGTAGLDWATSWSIDVDYADRFGLVVETGSPRTIVAHAAYVRIDSDRAEVAFLVADAWQGRGISTILAHLADAAEQHGFSTFVAEVLPHNHPMIDVFRGSGFPVELRSVPGALEIELPTSLSAEAVARFEERERTAAVAAVRSFLEPRSVAVIGASRRRGTIGGEIVHNLLVGGFRGAVYAVNDKAEVVQSLPAYRSVVNIPGRVELAVVAVPAEGVVDVARECAAAGVRALLVVSSGFAETGFEGAARQRELLEVCRDAGIRIVGPNCLGVLNTSPGVRLNATFAPLAAVPGGVGFMSQSGGLGIAIVEAASRLGVGLSSFVSVGNKSDLSGNDFLQYWEQDARTKLALLYLESFGNPRKFARIARRVSATKPILAVKSGRSAAGARATSSHTGAILSASDVTVDALFDQAGVIRTDTMRELFDVAALLSSQRVPRGDRVVIVTNGGGPGILCADACQASGVEVAELPAGVRAQLAEFLPADAAVGNPIDMIATASAADYRRTLQTLVDADACDAIITIFVPALVTTAAEVATAVREFAQANPSVTTASVSMVSSGVPSELNSDRVRVPGYEFPEDAARAVALAVRHGRWRAREVGCVPRFDDLRSVEAAAIVSQALARDEPWLSAERVAQLFDCYGLPLTDTRVVNDAEHAVARAGHRLDGLVVQPMAPAGVKLVVGVVHDHSFGPVLACGAGGMNAELVSDVAVRITPVTDVQAREMVHSLRTFPLLDGYRGAPRCDLTAIEEVLLRVSAMVEAHPEIVELDCNPLIAGPDGVLIVDARVRLETASPRRPMPSLEA